MKLSKKSLHFQLWQWFYGVKKEKSNPNNLCPYFWEVDFLKATGEHPGNKFFEQKQLS